VAFALYDCGKKNVTVSAAVATTNVKWVALSQVVRLGSQFLSIVILARLLPSSDFGLITLASIVTGFAALFRDFGTVSAIIQRQDLSASLLNSIFWFNIMLGCVMAIVLLFVSPLAAAIFDQPQLAKVICILALVFPLTSSGLVHQALMERASRFRPLAFIETFASICGLATAIALALSGYGVYSLVIQILLTASIVLIGLWATSSWRPRFQCSFKEVRGILSFSTNLLGYNVFNYFIRNADNILIGRFVGVTDLGYYTIAYRLMLVPVQNLANVLSRALFPMFSRMQEEKDRFSFSYMRVTMTIVFVVAPLMAGLFVLREPLVALILGQKWAPVANLLFWFAPIGLLQSISMMVGSIYLSTGRTDLMFKWGAIAGLCAMAAFTVGLQWGVEGMAAAYFVASLAFFWPSMAIPFSLIELQVNKVLAGVFPFILAAVIMAFLMSQALSLLAPLSISDFAMIISLGGVIYGALSFMAQRKFILSLTRLVVRGG